MKKSKRVISMLLCLTMIMSFMPFSAYGADTNTAAKVPVMDYDAAMEDAEYLVETIGVRLAGTKNEIAGLDYLEKQYEKLGYKIERQDFVVESRTAGDISIGGMNISAGTPSKNANFTGFATAKGTAVYLADPAKAAELGSDLSGKIVFFPGNCRVASGKPVSQATYDAIAKLYAAKAAGIVVMMDPTTEETERYQIRVSTPNFANAAVNMNIDIPVLVTNAMDQEKLTAYFSKNTGETAEMTCHPQVNSQNLIVTKEAAVETDKTIYVTCHIDSVLPSPGANDNASGIVGVLAMARGYKDIDTNYDIKFITFGSEEIGLQGAHYFAKNMTEKEIDDAIGNYNLDMIATSQQDCVYIFMNSSTNSSAPVNDPSLQTHVTKMASDAAKELGYDMEYYRTCYDRTTDHYALHLVGIPAVEFDWRANAAGTSFEAYYHTRFDDFAHNFSKDKLKTQLDVINLAVFNDATADYAAVTGEGVYREYYTSVADAIAAVENGGTVKLMKDSAEIITVDKETAFTIDPNGYAFTGTVQAAEGLALTAKDNSYIIRNYTGTALDTLNLDYDAAMEDAKYLVETIGVRLAGTKNEIAGLDYLEEQYKKLGYKIERQDFVVETRTAGDISIGGMNISAGTPSKNDNFTGFATAKGSSVYLADPAKVAELGDDLSGKIVFFPGNCRIASGKPVSQATYDAIAKLYAAKAAGIVVMMDPTTEETERYQIRVSTPNFANAAVNMKIDIPVLVTNAMDMEKLTAYFSKNTGKTAEMTCHPQVNSQNLIVTKEAAVETDKTIYVTCHIDSVLPSPGANDNASGIVGVLAMARALKDVDTNCDIQFITFGSEEIGLQGAHYFAKNLTEQQIADAIGNYNLDMIATSQENCVYIFMNSSTNSSAPVNDPSLETHVTRMSREAAQALGYDMEYYRTCYDRTTDHYALHLVGIPAVEFDWRANAAGTSFEAYYHTRFDDFAHNFSKDKLRKQLDVISLAVYNDATAEYAAVRGEGVYREYYTSITDAITADVIALEKELAELKEISAADKAALEATIAELTKALEDAESADDAEKAELNKAIAELEKALEEQKIASDKEITDLEADLEAEKQANEEEKAKLEAEINALKEQIEALKERPQLKAPKGVKASNDAKTGKIKVFWKTVEGADEYKVYRATSKTGKYVYMNTVTGTSYTNKTAKAGKVYWYKVKALTDDKAVDNSEFSAVVKRTADYARPVVTAKAGKKQVQLTWKKVEGAQKYQIYRATSKDGTYKKIYTTKYLKYTNKNLKVNKTYYYKVKAIGAANAASAYSVVDKCKTKA